MWSLIIFFFDLFYKKITIMSILYIFGLCTFFLKKVIHLFGLLSFQREQGWKVISQLFFLIVISSRRIWTAETTQISLISTWIGMESDKHDSFLSPQEESFVTSKLSFFFIMINSFPQIQWKNLQVLQENPIPDEVFLFF